MANPDKQQLYFDEIKEDRGPYFVEYHPPISKNPFATLSLVYPGSYELEAVGEHMLSEMVQWLARYPVPVMISAFDAAENVIRPNGNLDDAFLVGWLASESGSIVSSWKLDELPTFLNDTSTLPDLRTIYKDISFRTDAQVKEAAQKNLSKISKQNLILKVVLTLWLAVIPATWAVIQYAGPEWLGLTVLLYSLWQAWRTWRKLMGRVKPSRLEEEKAEKERKMAHYYYHCEQNPEGFSHLKRENFERQIRECNHREAEILANASSKNSASK